MYTLYYCHPLLILFIICLQGQLSTTFIVDVKYVVNKSEQEEKSIFVKVEGVFYIITSYCNFMIHFFRFLWQVQQHKTSSLSMYENTTCWVRCCQNCNISLRQIAQVRLIKSITRQQTSCYNFIMFNPATIDTLLYWNIFMSRHFSLSEGVSWLPLAPLATFSVTLFNTNMWKNVLILRIEDTL